MSSQLALNIINIKSVEFQLLRSGEFHYLVLFNHPDLNLQPNSSIPIYCSNDMMDVTIDEIKTYDSFDNLFADSKESLIFEEGIYALPAVISRSYGLIRLHLKNETCQIKL